jgi:hypothetical protein
MRESNVTVVKSAPSELVNTGNRFVDYKPLISVGGHDDGQDGGHDDGHDDGHDADIGVDSDAEDIGID